MGFWPAAAPESWTAPTTAIAAADHLVIALDDDPSVLTSLKRLLSAHGHPVVPKNSDRRFHAASR